MPQSLYAILPWIAAAGFLVGGLLITSSRQPSRRAWIIPAGASLAFALWTACAVFAEGLLGFWPQHIAGAWANQIWFDLLLAALVALSLLAPRARAVGMPFLPWFGLVAFTGSIGLLAMLARCLFLEARSSSSSL